MIDSIMQVTVQHVKTCIRAIYLRCSNFSEFPQLLCCISIEFAALQTICNLVRPSIGAWTRGLPLSQTMALKKSAAHQHLHLSAPELIGLHPIVTAKQHSPVSASPVSTPLDIKTAQRISPLAQSAAQSPVMPRGSVSVVVAAANLAIPAVFSSHPAKPNFSPRPTSSQKPTMSSPTSIQEPTTSSGSTPSISKLLGQSTTSPVSNLHSQRLYSAAVATVGRSPTQTTPTASSSGLQFAREAADSAGEELEGLFKNLLNVCRSGDSLALKSITKKVTPTMCLW